MPYKAVKDNQMRETLSSDAVSAFGANKTQHTIVKLTYFLLTGLLNYYK